MDGITGCVGRDKIVRERLGPLNPYGEHMPLFKHFDENVSARRIVIHDSDPHALDGIRHPGHSWF